jgi:RsiW-degrading membrane proteinase PrsW (M82 family)
MNNFKRVLIFAVIFILLGFYGIAIYYALAHGQNSGEVIVFCMASTCVLSIFVGIILRIIKNK